MDFTQGLTDPRGGGGKSFLVLKGALYKDGEGRALFKYKSLPGQRAPLQARALSMTSDYHLFADRFRGKIRGLVEPKVGDPPPTIVTITDALNKDAAHIQGKITGVLQTEVFNHMFQTPSFKIVDEAAGFRFLVTVPPFFKFEVVDKDEVTTLPLFGMLGLKRYSSNNLEAMMSLENHSSTELEVKGSLIPFKSRKDKLSIFAAPFVQKLQEEIAADNLEKQAAKLKPEVKKAKAGESSAAAAAPSTPAWTPQVMKTDCKVTFIPFKQERSKFIAEVDVSLDNLKGQDITGVTATMDSAIRELTSLLNLRDGVLRAKDGFIRREKHVSSGMLNIGITEDLQRAISANGTRWKFDMSKTFEASRTQITFTGAQTLTKSHLAAMYPITMLYPAGKPNSYVEGLGVCCVIGYWSGGSHPISTVPFTINENVGFMEVVLLDSKKRPLNAKYNIDIELILEMRDAKEQPLL